MKKILYLDMDNVIVDFKSALKKLEKTDPLSLEKYKDDEDEIPGIFDFMEPNKGAIEAVKILSEIFDVYVLTTAPWLNPSAWESKLRWVQKYFGVEKSSPLYKRLIITHHKNLNNGDFLVDDRPNNGAEKFKGELIKFNVNVPSEGEWERIVELLKSKK